MTHTPTEADFFREAVRRCIHTYSTVQFAMDTRLIIPYKIDEISLLFSTEASLDRFIAWAVEGGVDHFNRTVLDTMVREDTPHNENFDVRFEFLRLPGHDWRIEAMCVLRGKAPLHVMHSRSLGNGCVVHASFKCAGLPEMALACERLRGAGLRRAAAYSNAYGAFSYWAGVGHTYLKPRVNLRDARSVGETSRPVAQPGTQP
jgi:hypothetical protein